MQSHFEAEFGKLKKTIQDMAILVDKQVDDTLKALLELDPGLCKVVKARDDEIDRFDNLIQEQSENLLALFQPVALDLRYIIAAMMINTQLERCGDITVNIAQRTMKVIKNKELLLDSEIPEMARAASQMMHDAIEAFTTGNIDLARTVFDKDDIVDDFNKKTFKYLVRKMKKNKDQVEPCSHLLVLSRQLERLGDHATNIAEDVIFIVEAQIVTHQNK
ncbi:MAG TPA: phosphate signaling complex protein PhoU [bacterium]|nr:phosphate signaling complex protein PhoU [bacterium]HPN44811.1 phosphate signaling complex protein PhoU [bacterium]